MPEEQEQLPPGQKTLRAPEGCGFMDMPVLPVQVHLMCTDCEAPMPCVAQVPPLLVAANPGKPPMPDYLHQCPGCEKKIRMKQPFPAIRYAPHPTFSIATPEQAAEMEAQARAQQAALDEAFAGAEGPQRTEESLAESPETPETSQDTETPTSDSSEEE